MSSFYENTPGLQVKRDMNFSNVTIQCDPRLVVPDNATTQTSGILKKDTAGKLAVEHEICDLDVSNLTVNGTLIVPGNTVLSCTAIKADGAVCCPLTVENTNTQTSAQGGQVGNALCVRGSTLLQPLTNPTNNNNNTPTATIGALLYLDGTLPDGTNFLEADYMRIDSRPLTTGNAINIDISANPLKAMTGKGILINKEESNMGNTTGPGNGAPGGRLLYINAPAEHGFATQSPSFSDEVTLAEISGPRLEDLTADGLSGAGAFGAVPDSIKIDTEQSALWVNCVPQSGGALEAQRTAPVGALFVDGGTVFRGQAPSTPGEGASRGSHGHIHSSQVTAPKVRIAFSEGPGQVTAKVKPFSTDTCGRIDISETEVAGGTVIAQIVVTYTVPYPSNASPIVLLTPDQTLAKAVASFTLAAGIPPTPISLSFTGTPIFGGGTVDESVQFVFNIAFSSTGGTGNLIGSINYHVIGLI